jgi:hypothetical protein
VVLQWCYKPFLLVLVVTDEAVGGPVLGIVLTCVRVCVCVCMCVYSPVMRVSVLNDGCG